ncbi:MAG: zf-HC2 domain-containing protein [Spirochaetaceae bacterium]|jgi:anti-sigma factor RsiW|nr:zf-HC2 domain-containing protein [Spirochaetaceae bacterium]
MCPDRQILSVYFDQELPSPWKEKLEAHLADCSECRNRLEQYRRFSPNPAESEAAAVEAVKGRVWSKVACLGEKIPTRKYRGRWWARSVSLPIPAAAAAILFFALAAFFVIRPVLRAPQDTEVAAGVGLEVQGIVPVSDMNGVIQYLGGEDTADIVIIRLPESKRFMSSGEPAIIRAADYSGRSTSR